MPTQIPLGTPVPLAKDVEAIASKYRTVNNLPQEPTIVKPIIDHIILAANKLGSKAIYWTYADFSDGKGGSNGVWEALTDKGFYLILHGGVAVEIRCITTK